MSSILIHYFYSFLIFASIIEGGGFAQSAKTEGVGKEQVLFLSLFNIKKAPSNEGAKNYILSIFIRFVLPETPLVTPPVITILSSF